VKLIIMLELEKQLVYEENVVFQQSRLGPAGFRPAFFSFGCLDGIKRGKMIDSRDISSIISGCCGWLMLKLIMADL
jgi:hypothetical protein